MMIKRKVVWLVILMVWVGMVTSIIIYQGKDYLILEKTTSDHVNIIDEEMIDYTLASESQNNPVENEGEDFFIETKLERDKYRSEQINIYREMINNPNTDEVTKKEYHRKMMELTDKMEKEIEIESLIRARGYKDALAFIHDDTVDVIIETNGLEKNDVARVGDIIVKTTGFTFDDVTIIEKKTDQSQ